MEPQMTSIKSAISVAAILWLSATTGASSQQQDNASAGGEAFEKVQSDFALAYNRKDVEAMATAFSEDAIRVTPAGIFQGREAIRRNLQDALKMGLHDYSVRRTISRSYGAFVFNVGEWQAKLGNEPFHGSYSAILGRQGDQVKILEETVTVAAPDK
jgi:ketosteroid isomerase-like protein